MEIEDTRNLEYLEQQIARMSNRIDELEGLIGKGSFSNLVIENSPLQVNGGLTNQTAGTLINRAGEFLIGDLAAGSSPSIQGWTSSLVFSASDYRTVAWTAGTITLTDGTVFNIDAGNTGAMTAGTPYYIYLDTDTSITQLQKSPINSNSVGKNKILVAVAMPNSDTTSKATFQAFGGRGGVLLTVDNIAANSASINELISNTAQIRDAIITNAKIVSLDVGKLTAGTIVSKTITLSFTEGAGDCFIAAGKTDFDNDEAGFIMGIDDSDSNKVKFIIGTPTEYLAILGDVLVNKLKAMPYTASVGGVTLLSTTIERLSTSVYPTFTKLKEININRKGNYKLVYDLISYIDNNKKMYWSIRKNGAEFSNGWSLEDVYSQTLTINGLVGGEKISLYGAVESGADGKMTARYFDLKVDEADNVRTEFYTEGYN